MDTVEAAPAGDEPGSGGPGPGGRQRADGPRTARPRTARPHADGSGADGSGADVPGADVPGEDGPRAGRPRADDPGTDRPDATGADAARGDETGAGTTRADATRADAAGADAQGAAADRPDPDGAAPRRRGRRGRRPGGTDTRAELLGAARVEFARHGYEGATVRRIAERAGVDPAMVNHWFGGKEALFSAALQLPVNPATVLAEVVPGDPDRLGERIVARFLVIWDASGGGPMATVLRSIASHEDAARMLREFIGTVMVKRVAARVAPDRPDLRANLVGAQLFGMGLVRYVLRLEPLASADHATVIAAVAPTVQRYLTGPLV